MEFLQSSHLHDQYRIHLIVPKSETLSNAIECNLFFGPILIAIHHIRTASQTKLETRQESACFEKLRSNIHSLFQLPDPGSDECNRGWSRL